MTEIAQITTFQEALARSDKEHTSEALGAALVAARLILQQPKQSQLYTTDYNCARLLLAICV